MSARREPVLERSAAALELRVLSGPQAGARCALPASGALLVGVGDAPQSADVQLQGDAAVVLRLRIGATAEPLDVEVIEGRVQLGEHLHEQGARFAWQPRVALHLGPELVLAFGAADAPIWSLEAPRVASEADPAAAPPDPAPATAPVPPRRIDRWLAAGGALLATAGLAIAAMTLIARAPDAATAAVAPRDELARVHALLAEPDFAALTVERDAAGRARLTGRVAGEAQLARVRARLAAQDLRPALQPQVDEQLGAAVEQMLKLHGIEARAAVTGIGAVRLDGDLSGVPPAALERALADTRAALPPLRELRVAAAPAAASAPIVAAASAPPAPTLPSAGGEPGKRIVALVTAGLPHLVTADGARYFVGAVLPSGHRVAAVEPQSLLLERDGQRSRIDF